MKNWKETTLGEISKSVEYGYTESSTQEQIGPKFLRITDIQDDFIDWKNVPYCPISKKDRKKYRLEIGDVVIARTGNSTGATATIKEDIDAVFASYLIRFKIDPEKADYNYIDFLLRSNFWKGFVKSVKGGSAQGGANAKNFAGFPILLPPLEEQKEIAGILGSLDDKIELLREENKTLEATAQTLFKEWFVNFNFPNAEGKPYKSAGGKMIDSEFGLIPEGWNVGRLGDVFTLEYGKPLKEEDRTGKGYPVLGSNGIVGYHKEFLVKGDGVVVGRKGTMGAVVWVESDFYPIDTTFYVQDKLGLDKLFFHRLLLQSQDFTKVGSDSAVPGLNRNSAYSIETIIPPMEIIHHFHQIIESVFSKIKLNNLQIQNLSTLRDTLLPKLMKYDIEIG